MQHVRCPASVCLLQETPAPTPHTSCCHTVCHVPVQLHWESKHAKLPFDAAACEDLHAKTGEEAQDECS